MGNQFSELKVNSPFACLADSFVDGKGKICDDLSTSKKPTARAVRDDRVVESEFCGSRCLRAQIQLNEAEAEIKNLDRTAIQFKGAIRTAKFKKRLRLRALVPQLEVEVAEHRLKEFRREIGTMEINEGLEFNHNYKHEADMIRELKAAREKLAKFLAK